MNIFSNGEFQTHQPMESINDVHYALSRSLDTSRTVEDAVHGFMECWRGNDFYSILRYCQLGWIQSSYIKNVEGRPDQYPDGLLKSMYRNRKLDSYEILDIQLAIKHPSEPPLNPEVTVDVRVRIKWSTMAPKKRAMESKKKRKSEEYIYREFESIALFRCVRESGLRTLSPDGEWSVNPASTLREAK